MSYLEELLPEFRKGAKIRCSNWDKERFIHYLEGVICNDCDCPIFSEVADWTDTLLSDKWELYHEPDSDWDYIIKNKCLCWFWDDEDCHILGTLRKISALEDQYEDYKYKEKKGRYWRNCRPVRRNEVTFYEDRIVHDAESKA